VNLATLINDGNTLSDILKKYQNSVILCDQNTETLCLPLLNLNHEIPVISIPSGETNKSAFSLNIIWNKLLEAKADRNTILINIGGGVITDIGGLAAATYNRCIKFIHIPTTLMGMVDAANGGKTGINFNGLKNYIGTFTEPEAIYIWPEFLKTLPFNQIQSGFAEMLKHGLIADKKYFDQLISIDLKAETTEFINWNSLIQKSIEIKNTIVSRDFKESGERKLLNFGHTIGHALESHFINSNLPHGHFVSAGIICETFLSHTVGNLDLAESQKIIFSIDSVFERIPLLAKEIDEIAHLALKDKKNKAHKIKCVFLDKTGEASFDNDITLKDVVESLSFYNS
jgi:3-dehydroquinate synthase